MNVLSICRRGLRFQVDGGVPAFIRKQPAKQAHSLGHEIRDYRFIEAFIARSGRGSGFLSARRTALVGGPYGQSRLAYKEKQ